MEGTRLGSGPGWRVPSGITATRPRVDNGWRQPTVGPDGEPLTPWYGFEPPDEPPMPPFPPRPPEPPWPPVPPWPPCPPSEPGRPGHRPHPGLPGLLRRTRYRPGHRPVQERLERRVLPARLACWERETSGVGCGAGGTEDRPEPVSFPSVFAAASMTWLEPERSIPSVADGGERRRVVWTGSGVHDLARTGMVRAVRLDVRRGLGFPRVIANTAVRRVVAVRAAGLPVLGQQVLMPEARPGRERPNSPGLPWDAESTDAAPEFNALPRPLVLPVVAACTTPAVTWAAALMALDRSCRHAPACRR